MTRVCVVGGGDAGVEAAREAAMGGAEVTMIERSARPDPPWSSWPGLVAGELAPKARAGPSAGETLQEEARAVRAGRVLTASGLCLKSDALVLATGCAFRPCDFSGRRKQGVYVLDTLSRYSDFSRESKSASKIIIQGEGLRAVEVADRLVGDRGVTVAVTHWGRGEPSPGVRAVIERAAEDRGVRLRAGTVSKAVGSNRLEAVLFDGEVVPCEALALLPPRVPHTVPTDALRGRTGGFLVDDSLMTSAPGVFAAGGCAELGTGPPRPATLEEEALTSGRTAGANAAGGGLFYHPSGLTMTSILGLSWTRLGPAPLAASGASVAVVSASHGPSSACAIAYDRGSGRVVAVDAIEPSDPRRPPAPIQLEGATLQSLAYGGSSDISLISDTARVGLRSWQNCSSATTWKSNSSP